MADGHTLPNSLSYAYNVSEGHAVYLVGVRDSTESITE